MQGAKDTRVAPKSCHSWQLMTCVLCMMSSCPEHDTALPSHSHCIACQTRLDGITLSNSKGM